jgi:serine/threonine-protein kinase RsbT
MRVPGSTSPVAGETTQVVTTDADVVAARQRGRALAGHIGFTAGDQTVIAAAISELARNILLYARHGEIVLEAVDGQGRKGIKITARDTGPGIRDVPKAMTDGYSTSGGLGLGLPGARRLVDEFEIMSAPGKGTTIVMVKWKS